MRKNRRAAQAQALRRWPDIPTQLEAKRLDGQRWCSVYVVHSGTGRSLMGSGPTWAKALDAAEPAAAQYVLDAIERMGKPREVVLDPTLAANLQAAISRSLARAMDSAIINGDTTPTFTTGPVVAPVVVLPGLRHHAAKVLVSKELLDD